MTELEQVNGELRSRSRARRIPERAMQELFLVRHGETTGQSSVRLYGATDVPLSDLGREQVRAVACRARRHAADV